MIPLPLAACLASAGVLGGDPPTFSADVAPIVFRHCAGCHRPGQPTPFALTTYAQVKRRARMIARVTASGYMPPWLPAPGHVAFAGERRLTDVQVDTLAQWAAAGAPEGDPAATPPLPEWRDGWQRGRPDLVLQPERAFTLAADGPDQFRNLIIPIDVPATRFVAAVEIRPGTTGGVHHAILQIDPTRTSRRLAAADSEPGFAGMEMGSSEPADGHFLAWTPGKAPTVSPPGLAWRLLRGADLVLQVHMTPTGKPEVIQPRIGIYFAETPPTRVMYPLELFSRAIDIGPGVADYPVADAFVLPCDVVAHKIYPHAHYLCREMVARAILPDGREQPLLRIDQWDFNWQDEYTYPEPLRLPRGTRIEFDYLYDNTADNPRNPHQPPQRVRFGGQATDEMATLLLQLVPDRPADLALLREARYRHMLDKDAGDWRAHTRLATELIESGRAPQALPHLETALRLQPNEADSLCTMGIALEHVGRAAAAAQHYEQALAIQPDSHVALSNLGRLLLQRGERDAALKKLQAAVAVAPHFLAARINLGNALGMSGQAEQALEQFGAAIEIDPTSKQAHGNVANALLDLQRVDAAIEHIERALEIDPAYTNARFNLGRARLMRGERAAAIRAFEQVLRERPDFAPARQLLDLARRQ
ncbi:MAG: tetratricopeptide repeat protein [Planctomycetota bacterium]